MSEVKVDTISERTAAGGVTIDGVLIKDGVATFQTPAGSPLVFEGATADAFETTFAITDPTADRTITFPDASITLAAGASNTPQWFAYNSTATTNITSATWTDIVFDTEVIDTGSAFASNTFTVPSGGAGTYFMIASVCIGDADAGDNKLSFVRIGKTPSGGSFAAIAQSEIDWAIQVTTGHEAWGHYSQVSVQTINVLAEGDAITVLGYSTTLSGTPRYYGSGTPLTRFMGFKLA